MPCDTVIDGVWEENKLNGYAEMTHKTQKFIGDWKDDMIHGKGKENLGLNEFYAGTY